MAKVKDEITGQERQLISQLRERIENELPASILSMTNDDQDEFLVRWIRVRDLHLDNATKMLRNSLEWRSERNADNGSNLQISLFYRENFPYSYAGPDKNGHPVFLLPLADWDFRKVNSPERINEFENFVLNIFETFCKRVRDEHLRSVQAGQAPVTQFVFLLDVKNYPYGQLVSIGAIKKIVQLASTYEAHYPLKLHKGYFINCPFYFSMFINILKPVIAPKTLANLVCYSKMADWQKDMVEIVDPQIIPEKYGGTLKS